MIGEKEEIIYKGFISWISTNKESNYKYCRSLHVEVIYGSIRKVEDIYEMRKCMIVSRKHTFVYGPINLSLGNQLIPMNSSKKKTKYAP